MELPTSSIHKVAVMDGAENSSLCLLLDRWGQWVGQPNRTRTSADSPYGCPGGERERRDAWESSGRWSDISLSHTACAILDMVPNTPEVHRGSAPGMMGHGRAGFPRGHRVLEAGDDVSDTAPAPGSVAVVSHLLDVLLYVHTHLHGQPQR